MDVFCYEFRIMDRMLSLARKKLLNIALRYTFIFMTFYCTSSQVTVFFLIMVNKKLSDLKLQ